MTLQQKIFIAFLLLNLSNFAKALPANVDYEGMDKFLRDSDQKAPFAARKEFYYAFSNAQDMVVAGRLEQAKRAMTELHKIKTLNRYEESRVYLLDYWYQGKLGDKVKETEALTKLMPIGAGNVDSDAFIEAGIRLFKRQYNMQDYGSAIDTLSYLRKEPKSQAELDAIAPAVRKLDGIAHGTQDIAQQIKVDIKGKWNTKLLRPVFYLERINGEVHSFDFDCENQKSSMPYKPESMITIPASWGSCSVIINSIPDTTFHFVQLINNPSA